MVSKLKQLISEGKHSNVSKSVLYNAKHWNTIKFHRKLTFPSFVTFSGHIRSFSGSNSVRMKLTTEYTAISKNRLMVLPNQKFGEINCKHTSYSLDVHFIRILILNWLNAKSSFSNVATWLWYHLKFDGWSTNPKRNAHPLFRWLLDLARFNP